MFQQLVFLAPKNLIWDLMPKENTDLYSEMKKRTVRGVGFGLGPVVRRPLAQLLVVAAISLGQFLVVLLLAVVPYHFFAIL